MGAKHELALLFTKAMLSQVWKPDNERPGRHFVYTGRYVSFFTRLLCQLNDRPSLEALAKKNRKRSADFFNHTRIWEEVCVAYLKVTCPLILQSPLKPTQNRVLANHPASLTAYSARRIYSRQSRRPDFQASPPGHFPHQYDTARSLGPFVSAPFLHTPRPPTRSRRAQKAQRHPDETWSH